MNADLNNHSDNRRKVRAPTQEQKQAHFLVTRGRHKGKNGEEKVLTPAQQAARQQVLEQALAAGKVTSVPAQGTEAYRRLIRASWRGAPASDLPPMD